MASVTVYTNGLVLEPGTPVTWNSGIPNVGVITPSGVLIDSSLVTQTQTAATNAGVIVVQGTPPASATVAQPIYVPAGFLSTYGAPANEVLTTDGLGGAILQSLPGVTSAAIQAIGDGRYVPSQQTTTGAPTTGTWKVGQSIIDSAGLVWNCTVAGTPGTWVQAGSGGLTDVAAVVTAAGNLVASKHNPVSPTSTALTMNLPTGAAKGTLLSAEKYDTSANAVTLAGSIRGAASTYVLARPHQSVLLEADSTGSWWPVGFGDIPSTVYNVKAFGARGDAVSDDTTAIQAALTAAGAGGIVEFPPGIYLISAALNIPSLVIVRGAGPYSTIIRSTSTTADMLASSGTVLVEIRDLQLDSLVARTAGSAVAFTNVQLYRMDNVRFLGTYNFGTFIGCQEGWLDRINFTSPNGSGTTNRGFFWQTCIESHICRIQGDGGAVTLPNDNAWIQFDSGCDTMEILSASLVASSGHGTCLKFTHSLGSSSFAPRWGKFANLWLEATDDTNGSTGIGLEIQDGKCLHFGQVQVATSWKGVVITGGKDHRFGRLILVNNWLYGIQVTNTTQITDLAIDHLVMSDNSAGANGATEHAAIGSGPVGVRIGNMTTSNNLVGNSNKAIAALNNACADVVISGGRIDTTQLTTGVLTGTVTPTMRDVEGFNPRGPLTAPTMPASGTAVINTFGVTAYVFLVGGTVTAVSVGGNSTGTTNGLFVLPPGQYIALVYSSAPTWKWFGA